MYQTFPPSLFGWNWLKPNFTYVLFQRRIQAQSSHSAWSNFWPNYEHCRLPIPSTIVSKWPTVSKTKQSKPSSAVEMVSVPVEEKSRCTGIRYIYYLTGAFVHWQIEWQWIIKCHVEFVCRPISQQKQVKGNLPPKTLPYNETLPCWRCSRRARPYFMKNYR